MYFREKWLLLFLFGFSLLFLFVNVEARWHLASNRRRRYYRPDGSCRPRKNCHLSRWCSWSSCSATCGPNGVRVRTRHIIENASCGGKCGALRQVRRCNRLCQNGGYIQNGRCRCRNGYSGFCCENNAVNGQWSAWGQWCKCSKTCGMGYSSRVRHCDNPPPSNGGRSCKGSNVEHKQCYGPACSVDGQWGSWSFWCRCSKSCGYGQQTRTRKCENPSPSNGGKECFGAAMEQRPCHERQCPVDGGWSNWGTWCQCSTSCGPGTKSRQRHCTKPSPQYGGKHCIGAHVQHHKCNIKSCEMLSYYLQGCYKDARNRTMPEFIGNFKGHDYPIKWCLEAVLRHGYQAFGMQYGGECWSGPTSHITYSKYGITNTCKDGLGYHWANSVYFFGVPKPVKSTSKPTFLTTKPSLPVTHAKSKSSVPLTTTFVTTETPGHCWGAWSEWSGCSMKCGCGFETRVRFCTCGNGEHGSCSGLSEETRQCNCMACV